MSGRKSGGRRTGSMVLDTLFYDQRVGELTLSAFRLLIELNLQYDGFNNGNLSMTPKTLRFNWNAKTVKRARNELLQYELIEIVRPGVKRRPTLYALCHVPVNKIKKHGIDERKEATKRASGKRKYFYPVKIDLVKSVTEALNNRTK